MICVMYFLLLLIHSFDEHLLNSTIKTSQSRLKSRSIGDKIDVILKLILHLNFKVLNSMDGTVQNVFIF